MFDKHRPEVEDLREAVARLDAATESIRDISARIEPLLAALLEAQARCDTMLDFAKGAALLAQDLARARQKNGGPNEWARGRVGVSSAGRS